MDPSDSQGYESFAAGFMPCLIDIRNAYRSWGVDTVWVLLEHWDRQGGRRSSGLFGWAWSRGGKMLRSERTYPSADEAMRDLWRVLPPES